MSSTSAPLVPENAIVEIPEQPNGRQFIVVFNKPDDTKGPIRLYSVWETGKEYTSCEQKWYPCNLIFSSHYHAVAVRVPSDATLRHPNTDFGSFQSIDNVYSSECNGISQSTAYIAAEFGSDKFQGITLQFTYGDDLEDESLNDNQRYSNGLLCYSTRYAFFLRVYNDVVCGM